MSHWKGRQVRIVVKEQDTLKIVEDYKTYLDTDTMEDVFDKFFTTRDLYTIIVKEVEQLESL